MRFEPHGIVGGQAVSVIQSWPVDPVWRNSLRQLLVMGWCQSARSVCGDWTSRPIRGGRTMRRAANTVSINSILSCGRNSKQART